MLKRLLVPVLIGCVVGAGGLFALSAMGGLPSLPLLASKTQTSNTQVIDSIAREEQIVLLSLGIQGISASTGNSTFWGVPIPGSERAQFMQYSFNAKLGVEGRSVDATPIGDKGVRISLPGFIFIGHSNESFQTVVETNGILSFTTPEIDTASVITTILNDEAQQKYIASNREILQDQAKSFYTGIIKGIDPAITIEFEFRD